MRQVIYKDMQEDLAKRGKTVQTEADEHGMKSRWVKQRVHGELDATREAYVGRSQDAPMDLEVEGDIPEAQQESLNAQTEREATRLLMELAGNDPQERPAATVPEASSRSFSHPEPEDSPRGTSQPGIGSGDRGGGGEG